ncbi:sugar transferase [Peribacillus psychrosaccharolyticus]|uniref:sugar transferase n=1 Tax=Peribacillus psychrosaccharolyticus TaxID=1407 RepID=UPI00030EAF7E|nr:sugar transferase [Peribacillus psychrosaccharolyticus]MEC2056061.1 sugar transferase [Peribacillus psychrosaccharolyticus]MED3745502.1 sugar transferase [Peribacillus psychrosaccharolyticus]
MKRLVDFTFALLLILLLIPLLFILGFLIKLALGSPILFTQERPGLNGKLFTLYKFRSMSNQLDAQGNLLPDHIRLTYFGKLLRKFSLDELPQLFNVLKGDLSLVGPRPLLIEYLPLYTDEQAQRHLVKPGITGWAQVNGRNALTWEEKFKLDVWYVHHQTFLLDLKILLLTAMKVLKSEGINQAGSVTVEKFNGEIPSKREGNG